MAKLTVSTWPINDPCIPATAVITRYGIIIPHIVQKVKAAKGLVAPVSNYL